MTVQGGPRAAVRQVRSRERGVIVILAVALFACTGCAAWKRTVRSVDDGHASMSRGMADVVDQVDGIFGEPRVEDRKQIVRTRVGVKTEARENRETSVSIPVTLRLPLPALQRWMNVFLQFDTDPNASSSLSDIGTVLGIKETKSALTAAVVTTVRKSIDTGVKLTTNLDGGPQFGVQPFVRWDWRPGPVGFFAEQRVFYRTDDRFGGKTIASLDRILGKASFLRLSSSAEYFQELEGANWEHVLIYRRPFFGKTAALSAELGALWNPYDGEPADSLGGPEEDPDEAYAQIRLTGKLFRTWIEWEVIPAYHHVWRHEEPSEFGITASVKVLYEAYLGGPEPNPPAGPVP